MTVFGVPKRVLVAAGEHLAEQGESVIADAVADLTQAAPQLVDARAGLDGLLTEVLRQTHLALTSELSSGLTAGLPSPAPEAADAYARRLADRDTPAELLGVLFLTLQRVQLRHLLNDLAELVEPDDYARYAPGLVELTLAHSELGYRQAAKTYEETVIWHNRRRAVELRGRLESVLAAGLDDEALASRSLDYPMAGLHLGFVLQGDDPASLDLTGIRQRLATLPELREVLVVPLDDGTVAAWGKLPRAIDPREWAESSVQPLTLRVGVGGVAEGLPGFRQTHNQARQALRVAALVPDSHRIATYQDVAPLTFLAEDPIAAERWVGWALGDLAAPVTTSSACEPPFGTTWQPARTRPPWRSGCSSTATPSGTGSTRRSRCCPTAWTPTGWMLRWHLTTYTGRPERCAAPIGPGRKRGGLA